MLQAQPTSTLRSSTSDAGAQLLSVPSPPQENSVLPSAAAASPRTAPTWRSARVTAARCWPDCRLYLSIAPTSDPMKPKFPQAEMATAVTGAAGRAVRVCGARHLIGPVALAPLGGSELQQRWQPTCARIRLMHRPLLDLAALRQLTILL
eukprot:scaffold130306_cov30-Tisochrysis_lutea.AAC.3